MPKLDKPPCIAMHALRKGNQCFLIFIVKTLNKHNLNHLIEVKIW